MRQEPVLAVERIPVSVLRDPKLDDNVCVPAVHAGEGEWRHRAPQRKGAGEGVVDDVARQVFGVVLDPVRDVVVVPLEVTLEGLEFAHVRDAAARGPHGLQGGIIQLPRLRQGQMLLQK